MSSEEEKRVMIVDDEFFNLDIIRHLLDKKGFVVEDFLSSQKAFERLTDFDQPAFSLIVLDRMMPEINGIDFFEMMLSNPTLCKIPVLMQSARPLESQLKIKFEGSNFSYITKPYKKTTFIEEVESLLLRALTFEEQMLDVDESASYKFKLTRHHEIEHVLDSIISLCSPLADVREAIDNLLNNAIEHGNLAIGFRLKTKLLELNSFEIEANRRHEMPEYKDKKVYVHLEVVGNKYTITIRDDGDGFNWKDYFTQESLAAYGFSEVLYSDKGNEVKCTLVVRDINKLAKQIKPQEGW